MASKLAASAMSSASDRLLRAGGRLSVSIAIGPASSRSRTGSDAATGAVWMFIAAFALRISAIVSDLGRACERGKGAGKGERWRSRR